MMERERKKRGNALKEEAEDLEQKREKKAT